MPILMFNFNLSVKIYRSIVIIKMTINHSQAINVQCIFKDNTGNIWVGTEKGLVLYKPETETFIRLGEKKNLLFLIVFTISNNLMRMNYGLPLNLEELLL